MMMKKKKNVNNTVIYLISIGIISKDKDEECI